MAVKYHFSSQAVAWSGILRNGIGLIIRFREPTRIKLNEDEFFEVINVCFYYDSIMYMVTPGGKMHHVNEGKVYATTMMNGKMTPE
ncbi:MAG: hypothetical protein LBD62_01940 [Candidatus Margulisbacteria bacterium]|nr:hypothetical protein [Candidatus Margulisiibacteriota bacterium]